MKRVAVPTLMRKLALLVESCSETVNTEFAHLRKEQLDWQPNEKSWSISQCLAHLNAYYRYYIPVFRGKISNSRFKDPQEFFLVVR